MKMKTFKTNNIQEGTILLHTNARVKFEYAGEFKPQFTNQTFVELLNLKTGKTETFQKNTYLQYFEILSKEKIN